MARTNVNCSDCGSSMDLALTTVYAETNDGRVFVECCYTCLHHGNYAPMKVLCFEMTDVKEGMLNQQTSTKDLPNVAPVSTDEGREPFVCIPTDHLMDAMMANALQMAAMHSCRQPRPIDKEEIDRLLDNAIPQQEEPYCKENRSPKKPIGTDGFA